MGEVRPLVAQDLEERLAQKERDLLAEKEAVKVAQDEQDQLQEKARRSEELERALLEEQEALRKEVESLKLDKVALQSSREAELDAGQVEAGPAYLKSAEFLALDNEKYKDIVGTTVAAIRHFFRRDQPEVNWNSDRIWDAIGSWADTDVNSEKDEEDEVEDRAAVQGEGDGSEGSPNI
ncbi:unnamed protein product [Linum trigynum]|uniref:Uncharacterized protein n=1 Tax=Linum trigynum TaxID=586398 RepID=A0AAV2E2R0_9ROSI